jgi:hypothetical protein
VVTGWPTSTHSVSEGDHRLNQVQDWVTVRPQTFQHFFGADLRAIDFTDGRLAVRLDLLSDDVNWTQSKTGFD